LIRLATLPHDGRAKALFALNDPAIVVSSSATLDFVMHTPGLTAFCLRLY
jgi:hypothetical protein